MFRDILTNIKHKAWMNKNLVSLIFPKVSTGSKELSLIFCQNLSTVPYWVSLNRKKACISFCKIGSDSSLGQCKLSFEPSTTFVCYVSWPCKRIAKVGKQDQQQELALGWSIKQEFWTFINLAGLHAELSNWQRLTTSFDWFYPWHPVTENCIWYVKFGQKCV